MYAAHGSQARMKTGSNSTIYMECILSDTFLYIVLNIFLRICPQSLALSSLSVNGCMTQCMQSSAADAVEGTGHVLCLDWLHNPT